MRYEYSGYLKTLLHAPDPRARESLPHINISADDIAQWSLSDDEEHTEWQHVPTHKERTAEGVLLQGSFEQVRRIDNLAPDDPSFWVPLTSRRAPSSPFPIDASQYPIIELTYRCVTPGACPAWAWHYPGGVHFDGLSPANDWRTIARRIQHFGFPKQVDALTFRLFATTRTREAFEIQSVRFRAMSPGEAEACRKNEALIERNAKPRRYPLLDAFLPMGVCMHAGAAKRLAETMDMSFRDYWRLAIEDIARHHHNAIALEGVDHLSHTEWRELLAMSAAFGVRILAMHEWPMHEIDKQGRALTDRHIRPFADSPSILAWSVCDEPPDHTFQAHLQARSLIEEADPNHPLIVKMRDPNSLPLFAPFFAASGMTHFASRSSWYLGERVREHLRLSRGQQFWVEAPAFVYATDTPEWYTCPEMRLMLNQSFANGARGWFAFAHHNEPFWAGGSCQRSLTGPFLTFSDLWAELGNRMERFTAMAPLFLNAAPAANPAYDFQIEWREHPRARRGEHVPPIEHFWLEGNDYALFYIFSNDIGEVTPVNLTLPDNIPRSLEVYDVTDFVRSRSWSPMERKRHLEMFPGQGQVLLVAEPRACAKWRDAMLEPMIEDDRRQIAVDLGLARRYDLDISRVQRLLRSIGTGSLLQDAHRTRDARELLLNLQYAAPRITVPRSRLIQASAAICGCDGTLCRLLNLGRADQAQEFGGRVLALTRELVQLILELRRGRGAEITERATALAERSRNLLTEIRTQAGTRGIRPEPLY